MKRFIVLDGPRCSGKTRLAMRLKNEYNFAYHKPQSAKTLRGSVQMMHLLLDTWMANKMYGDKHVVIDRFLLTEFVYRAYDGIHYGEEFWSDILEIGRRLEREVGAEIYVLKAGLGVMAKQVLKTNRDQDMIPPVSRALWQTAATLFNARVLYNGDEAYLEDNVEYIAHRFPLPSKQP